MPDRFSEDEARRIFARAAERQHSAESRPEGLSLAELQEIAQDSGIDPAHVVAAVMDVRSVPDEPEPATVWGINLEPRRSRVIPFELSDSEWAQVVSRLRRTFKSKGIPTEVGSVREWSSGADSNLLVTASPVEGGTRITLESSRAHEFKGTGVASAILGSLLAVFVGVALGFGEWYVPLVVVLVSALAAATVYGVSRIAYGSWSRTRQDQFDALLDQIELIARSEPSSRAAEPDHAPLLDLDALEDTPSTSARPRGRDRA